MVEQPAGRIGNQRGNKIEGRIDQDGLLQRRIDVLRAQDQKRVARITQAE